MSEPLELMGQPQVVRLAAVLLHFLWQGALVYAAIRVARGLLHDNPGARHGAGLVGLAAMLAAPLATFVALDAGAPSGFGWPAVAWTVPGLAVTASTDPSVSTPGPGWQGLVVLVWVLGALVGAARSLQGWLWLRGLRCRSTPAPAFWRSWLQARSRQLRVACPSLRLTVTDVPPMLVGWLRPSILLPLSMLSGLPPGHIEALLTHELVHLRRRDHLVNLLQVLLETLLFYHPAVWWLSRDLRHDRELACDRHACELVGRPTYARALLAAESLRCATAPSLAPAATGPRLVDRIRYLTSPPAEGASMRRPLRVSLTVALLTLATLTSLAGVAATRALAADPGGEGPPTRVVAEIQNNGIVRLTAMGGSRSTTQIVEALNALASQFDADVVYLQGNGDTVSVEAVRQGLERRGLTTEVRMTPPALPPQRLPAAFPLHLETGDTVKVEVFDIHGNVVKTLHQAYLPAGAHELTWTRDDFSPAQGTYFARVRAGAVRQMWKVVVLP